MTRLRVVAAILTWAAVVCIIVAAAGPRGAAAGGVLDVRTLAVVSGLSSALTLGLILLALPSVLGYIIAHATGLAALVTVMSGVGARGVHIAFPIPFGLWSHGAIGASAATLVVVSVGLAWELSYACTWLVVHDRQPWLALGLIVGIVMVVAHPQGHEPIYVTLCALALALAAVTTAQGRHGPSIRRAPSGSALRRVALLAAPASMALIAGAWIAPVPPAVATPGLSASGWSGALDGFLARVGVTGRPAGDPLAGLGGPAPSLPVGGTFHPDDTLMFIGRVADAARAPYWRGAVYDTYTAGAWHALPESSHLEASGAPLPLPSGSPSLAPMTATVQPLRPLTTLFTDGSPVRIGLAAYAALPADGTPAGVLSARPVAPAIGHAYATASLPEPDGPLASVPALAPSMSAVDLALPRLPARVGALARRLTEGLADPYARAWAIVRYLRSVGAARPTFRYDPSPPPAPAGRDPTDYFLFTSHSGFCTHFASAMVVLARDAGIPARLVTGYAAGQLQASEIAGRLTDIRFVVRSRDAHAWPQLWIKGRGWITFEPTPGYSTPFGLKPPAGLGSAASSPTAHGSAAAATARSRPPSPVAAARRTARPGATAGRGTGGGPHADGGSPTSIVLATIAVIVVALAGAFVLYQRASVDIPTLYHRMSRLADLLRCGPREGQTPLEWATSVAGRAPDDAADVLAITNLYVRQRYGRAALTPPDAAVARARWRSLRRRWLRRLLGRQMLG